MSSIFTKIVEGELPSYKIYESETIYSFLALDQINLGHCLVIPKKETDHFFDMDSKEYEEVFAFSKKLSQAIKTVTDCKRVGMAVQGFEVPHAHVHLIPLNSAEEFRFSRGQKRSDEEMTSIQKKLTDELKNL